MWFSVVPDCYKIIVVEVNSCFDGLKGFKVSSAQMFLPTSHLDTKPAGEGLLYSA